MTKNGDTITYTINVRRLGDGGGGGEAIVTLQRQYEDLQYLDHLLTTSALGTQPGIIFPPLPAKPATDPAGAESRSKRQLGSRFRKIISFTLD